MLGRLLGVSSRSDKDLVHNRSEVLHGKESSDVRSEDEHSVVGHSDAVIGSHGAGHDHSVANERDATFNEELVYSRYS